MHLYVNFAEIRSSVITAGKRVFHLHVHLDINSALDSAAAYFTLNYHVDSNGFNLLA